MSAVGGPNGGGDVPPRVDGDDLAAQRLVLRSSLVSDALDAIGLRRQALGPDIRPLSAGGVLLGYAFTISATPVEEVPETPYQGLLAALDALTRDDIFVLATGRSERFAAWGELVSIAARAAGAVGMITDGLVRDLEQVDALGFPVFARGTMPVDISGRADIVGHGLPIVIDGVTIEPGDVVVADADGVVVVPTAVRDEVLARAIKKSDEEDAFRDALASGMSASEAFARFHVL